MRDGRASRSLIGELVERTASLRPGDICGAMLDWLSADVGCDSVIFVPALDRRMRPVERNKQAFIHLHELYAREPQRYRPGMRKGHAALAHDRAYIDNDVYSSSERRELPFYADIIRPQRISSQLILALDFHGRRRATIHLCRHGPVQRFHGSVVEHMRAIIPALALIEAAASLPPPVAACDHGLGPRELEVACLAGRGLSTKEIAALLGTRPATVRNQLHTIYRKLDVSNRAELAFVLAGDSA